MDAVVSPTLVQHLRTVWEAANNGWNQWVLNHTQARQFDLLKTLGFAAPSWLDLVRLLGLLICAAAPAGALWALWERSRQDPWQRLLLQARDARLARAGLARCSPAHLPPRHGQPGARSIGHPPRPPRNGCCAWSKRYAPQPDATLGQLRRETTSTACPGPRHNRPAPERHDILDLQNYIF